MKIVRCDICNNEMRACPIDRDSETQYYTLINKSDGRELGTDICNECMHKLIDFVKAPSVVPTTEPQTYITEDRDTQILDAWQVHHRNTTTVEDAPSVAPKTQIETQNLNENSNEDAISREGVLLAVEEEIKEWEGTFSAEGMKRIKTIIETIPSVPTEQSSMASQILG